MANIREKSPYAGLMVKTKPGVGFDPMTAACLSDQDFLIEDWWQNVYGRSWKVSNGVPAAMSYALRTGATGGKIPLDDEVLYGKIGMFGYLFHISELCLPGVS